MNTTGTTISLLERIDPILSTFTDEISLENITCKNGKLLTITPKGVVRVVKTWKVVEVGLGDICNFGLQMILDRLTDVYNKRQQGFDK